MYQQEILDLVRDSLSTTAYRRCLEAIAAGVPPGEVWRVCLVHGRAAAQVEALEDELRLMTEVARLGL